MQTNRTQLSVQLSVLLAAVCIVFLLVGGAAEAGEPPAPAIEYVVAQGDTLWEIAAAHTEDTEDVRRFVRDIKQRTGLTSSVIHPGQVLQIPQS